MNSRAEGAASVAGGRWGWAFVALFGLELLVKLAVAAHLPLFGDEAFYWLESRHLAWGYSDLPGMTAWLIAGGVALGGHALLAVRALVLVLGSAVPWLVVAFARRHFGARVGWQAGLLASGLPLAGTLGVLALPDVALTFAVMLAVLALDRALADNRRRWWLLVALALIVALASHYRAGMLLLAGLVFATATARGRTLWRKRRWYAALAGGALGAVPALIYNLGHQWAGFRFQLVDRNPWSFQPRALLEPVGQALAVSPLLYALILWTLWLAWRQRRRGAPWDLVASVGAVFLGGYFVLGLFADSQRFHVHWPLPGYLPLLALVPGLAARLWWARGGRPALRGALMLAWVCLAGAQLIMLGFLAAMSLPAADAGWLRHQPAADVFTGWQQAGQIVRRELERPALRGAVVVADNFRLAAELAFALQDRQPVYTLDSPLNRKHGRAVQLADWRLDEAGLFAAHAGARVLLVVEETALRARQQPAWLGSICRRFAAIQPLARMQVGDDKRIAFYAASLRATPGQLSANRDACIVWREAYAHYPEFVPSATPNVPDAQGASGQ